MTNPGTSGTSPDDSEKKLGVRYEAPSTRGDLHEMADDFERLELDMADGTRDLTIDLTASEFNKTLDAVKRDLDKKRKLELNGALDRQEKRQIKEKYKKLEREKKEVYKRLRKIFFPLEAGGLEPKLEYVLLEEEVVVPPVSPPPSPPPFDDEVYDPSEAGKVATMMLVIKRPDSPKETKKMRDLLRRQMKDWKKVMERTGTSAVYAAEIQGAKCMTDIYAELLGNLQTGEPCSASISDPATMAKYANYTPSSNIQASQCAESGGLMAGEMFENRDTGQKARFSKVATLITLGVTIYGIIKAIKGDKGWQSALSVFGMAGLATYVWKGKFKLPHQMVKEGLQGGDTYDRMCGLMGIEEEYRRTPVKGMEGLSLQASATTQMIGGLTPKILRDEKLIEVKDGKIILTAHPADPNSSKLAAYLASRGDKENAGAANNYFIEQQKGFYHFDTGLAILGAKDDIINKKTSETTIMTYSQAYEYRAKTLDNFMTTNNLEINPAFRDTNLVQDYLCHTKSMTIEDLVAQGVFQQIKSIDGYVPSFAPVEQADALSALPKLRLLFDGVTVTHMKQHLQLLEVSTTVSLNREEMYTAYPVLKNRVVNETKEAEIDAELTKFFSQVIPFMDDKAIAEVFDGRGPTMKEFFDHYQVFLENYQQLGTFANINHLGFAGLEDPKVLAYIQTDFTKTPKVAALATVLGISFTTGASPKALRDEALTALQQQNVLVFNTSGYGLLDGIEVQDPEVQAMVTSLTGAVGVDVATELALWGVAYDRRMSDVLPTSISITAVPPSSVIWKAYGQEATIDFATKKVTVNYGGGVMEILTDDGFDRGTVDLLQIAQLATMMMGNFMYDAKTGAPWEEHNGRIDFGNYNSFSDALVDVRSNMSNLSEAKKRLLGVIDTTLLSKQGMKTYFPTLLKMDNLDRFVEDMNTLPIWHAESNEKRREKKAIIVENTLTRMNTGPGPDVTIKRKAPVPPATTGKIDFAGPVLTLELKVPGGVTKDITLDVLNNQLGDYGLGTVPDLETATDMAVRLLRVAVAVATAKANLVAGITSLPSWMISVIGPTNWANIKSAGKITADYLKDIFGAIGGLAGKWLNGSKDFAIFLTKLAGLPAQLVSRIFG